MLNVNVGLLGHVDSGKTALAKALSRTASTAAFDKSPQSQSRGITLDLGFSACEVAQDDSDDARTVLRAANLDKVQCTLVDCPGHASLIRTVVGGAQIIDAMVLVIDATKGMQAQTAECLVLGEVLAKPLVVALNKVDAVQGATPAEKTAAVAAMKRKLQLTFRRTRWPTVTVVEVAAAPRDVAEGSRSSSSSSGMAAPYNIGALLPQVLRAVDLAALKAAKAREGERPERFYMLVDHCFAVRGQGTVFTGTVVAGMVRVGDTVLVPDLQTTRKVKGLQVFHQPVETARSGDRVGLCVAQFDPASMERGVLCSSAGSERTLVSTSQLIAQVHKVRYHPFLADTHTKFHITIGHATVMGTMRYFSRPHVSAAVGGSGDTFDPSVESAYVEELGEAAVATYSTLQSSTDSAAVAGRPLPIGAAASDFYAVLLLERPVLAAVGNAMVAMRLDVERDNFCRIALAGSVCHTFPAGEIVGGGAAAESDGAAWRRLNVVRYRARALRVDRVLDSRSCIADGVVSLDATVPAASGGRASKPAEGRQKSDLFSEVQKFLRLRVVFEPEEDTAAESETAGQTESATECDAVAAVAQGKATGTVTGVIDSTFGKTGKVKLVFAAPVFAEASTAAKRKKKTAEDGDDERGSSGGGVFLRRGRLLLILKKHPFALHSGLDQ